MYSCWKLTSRLQCELFEPNIKKALLENLLDAKTYGSVTYKSSLVSDTVFINCFRGPWPLKHNSMCYCSPVGQCEMFFFHNYVKSD